MKDEFYIIILIKKLIHDLDKYLTYYFIRIKEFLSDEHLKLNSKTRIYESTNNIAFLGRNIYNRSVKYRDNGRKLKYKRYLYDNGKITFNSYLSSYINYKNIL